MFATAGMSPGPHVVVLAAVPGESATTVLVSPLAPAEAGEPIATEALLVAPRCPRRSGCGDRSLRAHRSTRTPPRRSRPGGGWLAVVELDATVNGPTSGARGARSGNRHGGHQLRRTRRCRPGRLTDRRWRSPERERCRSSIRPPTRSPASPPEIRWSRPRSGAHSASSSSSMSPGTSDVEHLELADSVGAGSLPDPRRDRRLERPGDLTGRLAARLPALRPPVRRARGSSASAHRPRRRDHSTASLQPVGFTATGTLLGINRPPNGIPTLVLVSVAGDEQIPVASGPGSGRSAPWWSLPADGSSSTSTPTPTASSRRMSRTPTGPTPRSSPTLRHRRWSRHRWR